MIALSLTAILITFLFSFFVETAKIEKKLEVMRTAIMKRGHLQNRLQTVFSAIDRSSMDPFFYTKPLDAEKSISLVTIYDNGIDPDPAFSGSLTGRIFLDEENRLCLVSWPLSKEKPRPWRKEVLHTGVKKMEFQFLGEKSEKEHFVPVRDTLGWKSLWPKNLRGVPSLIRLTLYEENSSKPIHYAFILPVAEPLVTYTDEKKVAL
jgi:hypothetical protein